MVSTMWVLRDLGAWARDDVYLLQLSADLLATRANQAEGVEDCERQEGSSRSHHVPPLPREHSCGGAIIVWQTLGARLVPPPAPSTMVRAERGL
eukprot:4565930-Pyramimonas_sp.AAC.1